MSAPNERHCWYTTAGAARNGENTRSFCARYYFWLNAFLRVAHRYVIDCDRAREPRLCPSTARITAFPALHTRLRLSRSRVDVRKQKKQKTGLNVEFQMLILSRCSATYRSGKSPTRIFTVYYTRYWANNSVRIPLSRIIQENSVATKMLWLRSNNDPFVSGEKYVYFEDISGRVSSWIFWTDSCCFPNILTD